MNSFSGFRESGSPHTKWALALLCALVIPLAGCQNKIEAAADQPVPVRLQIPQHIQQPESVEVSGSVEANVTALTAFQVGGRVAHVYVEEGQKVTKGQVLADLDPTDYRNAYEAALGEAQAAKAGNLKAEAGLRQQELEQARIDFERTKDEYQRLKYLYDHQSLPANDYHKIEAAYLASEQRYDMARAGTRVEDKQGAAAQSAAATAAMQEAKKRLSDCQLRAPISGYIGMRQLEVGNTIAPGMPVFSVVDLNPVKVRVGIPEAEIGKIRQGDRAEVSIPSLGGQQFSGRVEAIAAASDPASRTYVSKIAVENPKLVLRAGMVAEARLVGETKVNAVTIPGSAVVRDERGVTKVYVLNVGQNRVYSRRIELGPIMGDQVAIRNGLNGDDRVVVEGQHYVREGSTVQVQGGAL